MRFVVTGAAGFIGSHLAEALRAARPRRRRARLLHRLLRPGAEGGERRAALDVSARVDLAEDALDFARLRRRLPPRRAAGRAQLRRRLPALPAPERARLPAGLRGGRARRRQGRLRLVVVGLRRRRALPDARGDARRSPLSPYGITQARLRAARGRVPRASSGSTASSLRYFNAFGPRQRPDMAFTRIVNALATGGTLRALRRRRPVAQLDVRRRRRRRRRSPRWSAAPAPTTSAARSRRR